MMTLLYKTLFLSILIIFHVSCQQNVRQTESRNTEPVLFPVKTGVQWTYIVNDSILLHTDTVRVRIGSSIQLHGGTEGLMVLYQYPSRVDTHAVSSDGNEVRFYPSVTATRPSFIVPKSPRIGQQWTIPVSGTFRVVSRGGLALPAGLFPSAYRIHQNYLVGNFFGGTDYWIDPAVGILRIREDWLDNEQGERMNTDWKLLYYSFNNP